MNLLRAKVVPGISELNKYDYSGHSALVGNKKRKWQDTKYVLSYFGRRVGEAKKSYISYVEEGIKQGRRPEVGRGRFDSQPWWMGGYWARVIL